MNHRLPTYRAPATGTLLFWAWMALMLLLGAASAQAQPQIYASEYPIDYYKKNVNERVAYVIHSTDLHHTAQAERALTKRDYDAVHRELKLIIGERIPNHPRGLLILLRLNKVYPIPNAEEYLERAIEMNPSIGYSHMAYGMFLHQQKKPAEAVARYERAIELDPQLRDAYYNAGLAYADLKQFDKANEAAQKAYGLGHPLRGLEDRLKKAGKWRPNPS